MRLRLGELRSLLREARDTRYYHVTSVDLGDEAILEPVIPQNAIDMMEEDFTTPRVCFASSYKKAVLALAGMVDFTRPVYVYGVRSIPHMFKPRSGDYPPEVYTPTSKNERAKAVEGFVPDAGETGEVWSTLPIRAKRVETIKPKGRYKEAIEHDCWGGTRPEETYSELLFNDEKLHQASVLVPDDVKKSLLAWARAMKLTR